MNAPSGNQKPSFLDFLLSLFRLLKPTSVIVTPAQPVIPPNNSIEPVRIETSRVLLVIYNPVLEAASGTKIIQSMNWNNPDDLSNTFIQDILEVSGGLARFEIVDGFRYDAQSYLAVINKA